jgi:hypothetical protein
MISNVYVNVTLFLCAKLEKNWSSLTDEAVEIANIDKCEHINKALLTLQVIG